MTEDLAAFLSEVTQGELRQPAPGVAGDVGDLYLHIVDQNLRLTSAITNGTIAADAWPGPRGRASFDVLGDGYGGSGLEAGYRQVARLTEDAFAAATDDGRLYAPMGFPGQVPVTTLYEVQISSTVIHTWDVAQALGFDYQPAPDITQRILRAIVSWPARPASDADTLESVLARSGRAVGGTRG